MCSNLANVANRRRRTKRKMNKVTKEVKNMTFTHTFKIDLNGEVHLSPPHHPCGLQLWKALWNCKRSPAFFNSTVDNTIHMCMYICISANMCVYVVCTNVNRCTVHIFFCLKHLCILQWLQQVSKQTHVHMYKCKEVHIFLPLAPVQLTSNQKHVHV